ncbi:uncharacterized protein VTP21DRAFT_3547 [Calcarisporiella thermophila]|uniref:uncharacterized protein n=1 Tax=Calcarisporiella thermophila TaxID=911321 RepID=UPI003743D1ED
MAAQGTSAEAPALNLTPRQIHYLKKELLTIQLQKEIQQLPTLPSLKSLQSAKDSPLPLLQFVYSHFVVTFPFLTDAENDFWAKMDIFMGEINKRHLSTTSEREEMTKRRKMMLKAEKSLVLLFNAAIRTPAQEESIRPLDLIEIGDELNGAMFPGELGDAGAETLEKSRQGNVVNGLDINVSGVREIYVKRTVREHPHAEFLITTRFVPDNQKPGDPEVDLNASALPQPSEQCQEVVVARRFGQFRALHEALKREYPTVILPALPPKSREYAERRPGHFYRERDRLSLRYFLRRLSAIERVARSSTFIHFLTEHPLRLTEAEREDAERRVEMDLARVREEQLFQQELDKRIRDLSEQLDTLKREILQPGGLSNFFQTVRGTPQLRNLPPGYQKAFEWGRISFASTLHSLFVTSDGAAENQAILKRTHGLVPYRAIGALLRISNPLSMMKGVLDLLLAQPFGQKSLFQRIVLANLNEETREMQKDIDVLEARINDVSLCLKIRNAASKLTGTGEEVRGAERIIAILQNEDIEPRLTAQHVLRFGMAPSNPEEEKTRKRQLRWMHQLWVLYIRKRDQEQLMQLVFQGITGELIRDLFAIFYRPLAQIYKSANISDFLVDVSKFIEDLIRYLDSIDMAETVDTVQPLIELIERHEQTFYSFIHAVHRQDREMLFDRLIKWMECILTFLREGLTHPLDLNELIGKLSVEEREALRQEAEALCEHHVRRKRYHLEKMRRRVAGEDSSMAAVLGKEQMVTAVSGGRVQGFVDDLEEMEFVDDETSEESWSEGSGWSEEESWDIGDGLSDTDETSDASEEAEEMQKDVGGGLKAEAEDAKGKRPHRVSADGLVPPGGPLAIEVERRRRRRERLRLNKAAKRAKEQLLRKPDLRVLPQLVPGFVARVVEALPR